MTKKSSAGDELGELLAERDRIEAWLTALEGRKETTPPQVFAKVHGDYSVRRDALLVQLRDRTGELDGKVEKLAAKLAAVESEQRGKQEARAEAELRAAVGEFTDTQWAELATASDAELATLEARRTEVAREHAQAVELLTSVRRSGAHQVVRDAPSAARAPARAAEPELVITALGDMLMPPAAQVAKRASQQVARASAAVERLGEAVARESGATDESPAAIVSHRINTPNADELAFLRSMELDTAGQSGAPPAPPPSRTLRQVPAESAVKSRTPTPASSPRIVEPPAARPAPPAAAEAVPARAAGPDPRATRPTPVSSEPVHLTDAAVNVPRASTDISPDAAYRRETAPRLTSRDSANLLKGVQSGHGKTLKCAGCGAANFPTEWYCERCGSELSAV